MAVRTVKARVELDGEKEYKEAISHLNAGMKTLGSEMKLLQAQYKDNADSMEFLTAKGDLLQRQLDQQKAKTDEVRKMVEAASRAYEAAAQAQAEAADKDAAAQAEAAKAVADADKKLQEYMSKLYSAQAAETNLTNAIEENSSAIQAAPLKEYADAINKLDSESTVLESEMRKLEAQFQGNAESEEFLTAKGKLLEQQLEKQKEKTAQLRAELSKAKEIYGEDSEEVQKLTVALNDAETAEIELSNAMNEDNEDLTSLGETVQQLADKFGITLPEGLKTSLDGMEGLSAGTVAKMAAMAAAVAAVIKVVKELTDLTLEVAAQMDEYVSESAITGVPTQVLQAWDYAAPLIDTDAETIKGAMTKITKAMGDAGNGSDAAAKKFKQLGVSITDEATGQLRSAEDVFYDVVDALGEIENSTERDAAAMDLLGKSAQELNPLINAGSKALKEYGKEAESVGYILSEDQVAALTAADDAYQRLQLTIQGVRNQIAADFAPAAESAMNLFSDAVKKAGEFLERSGLIKNLGSILQSIFSILDAIGETISNLPGLGSALDAVNLVLKGTATILATIADAVNVVAGLLPSNWGSGMARTALGWNIDQGQMSNLQKLHYSSSDYAGWVYNEQLGTWTSNNYNATGNDNWKGGLTWVGEAGPELVALPAGSQIMNTQDSRNLGGDTFYITIDAASVKDFNDIVEIAQSARVRGRMR